MKHICKQQTDSLGFDNSVLFVNIEKHKKWHIDSKTVEQHLYDKNAYHFYFVVKANLIKINTIQYVHRLSIDLLFVHFDKNAQKMIELKGKCYIKILDSI